MESDISAIDREAGSEVGRRPLRRRRRLVTIAVLAALLAGIGGYLAYWACTGRIATVHEGHLYRSGALPADRLIQVCNRYGIRTVVDFRMSKAKAAKEAEVLRSIGVNYVNLPSDQVPTPEVVEGFLAVMNDPKNLPVLIHCHHGVGRTGLHAAIYRMEFQGWSNACARWEAMLMAGFGSFQKGTPKAQFLEDYRPSHRQAAPLRESGSREGG